jgi:hypothetical protein
MKRIIRPKKRLPPILRGFALPSKKEKRARKRITTINPQREEKEK